MFLIILAYAVLGSTFVIAKTSLYYAKPFFLIGFRMVLAGSFLLGYNLIRKKSLLINREDIPTFIKVVFTHIYITFIFEFWALSHPSMGAAKTCLIFSATPFIMALLSYLLLSEKLGLRKMLGMAIGILGLVPILIQNDGTGSEFLSISFPELILLIAVFSGAYAWFDIKKLMAKGYSLVIINGFAMFFGGWLAFITSAIFEGMTESPVYDYYNFIKYVLALILASNVIFYNMYGWLMTKYSLTFLSFVGFLSPIFGAFYAWFFLGEAITWHYFLSLTIIIAALSIFYQEELKS